MCASPSVSALRQRSLSHHKTESGNSSVFGITKKSAIAIAEVRTFIHLVSLVNEKLKGSLKED